VEKTLLAQVVSPVEVPYIAAVCNLHTGRYNILAVLQHIFTIYGHITSQHLNAREMEICKMHFDMALPVDAILMLLMIS